MNLETAWEIAAKDADDAETRVADPITAVPDSRAISSASTVKSVNGEGSCRGGRGRH